MSDIVFGALIGVGAAALGSIITGIINYKNSTLQISARRDELNQQLSHQEREAKISRLIEARKEHLFRLRNILSKWVECSNQQVNMDVRLDKAIKSGDSFRQQLNISEYNETSELGKELTSQLNILRRELSDNIVDDLIKAIFEKQSEIDIARMPIVRFFNNPEGADSSTIESVMREEELLFEAQRKKLIEINKRIEELLNGEPSA